MKKQGGGPITLATSHPIKSSTKLQKIKNVISSTAHSNKPLGIKPTIHKGGDILDVLESYENNDVNESIIGGKSKKSKKKGGDILDVLESYENNDVNESIIGGKSKKSKKKGGDKLIDNFKNILKVN